MANPNWGEITTTTLHNRRRRLADNVLKHNALLRHLNERGNVNITDGGETLVEELEYAENDTFMYYSGYELLNVSPSDVLTAAEYNWKQAAVVVTISGEQQRKNSGRERMIRLLSSRIRNAEKTMINNTSIGIYSDGTGSAGKQFGGLQLLVADSPATGTVGGIDRANYAFWRNQVETGVTGATNIQSKMNAAWTKTVRGADRPTVIVADATFFEYYQSSLQSIQRITTPERGALGYESLAYYGTNGSAPVMYDDACPANHMYMLNSDFIFWRPHREANVTPLSVRESVNQDAIVRPIVTMANMTLSNAARQAVLTA